MNNTRSSGGGTTATLLKVCRGTSPEMACLTLRKDIRDEGGMPGLPELASLTSACMTQC